MRKTTTISELLGKTLYTCEGKVGDKEIRFKTTEGVEYVLYHEQDCCEDVEIVDICGELSDLVDSPIIQAEESSNSEEHPPGVEPPFIDDTFTWTFYRLATAKGQVVIRWYGSSNGYYSESVDFARIE